MKHLSILLFAAVVGPGCTTVAMVEILSAIAPDATCIFSVSGNPSRLGYYDPTVDNRGYTLALLLRNNLQQRTDDTQVFGTTNVRNRLNDVELLGFEGCWFQSTTSITKYADYADGVVMDCNTLPNQSGSFPANGEIDEGGMSTGVMMTVVLTPPHLKQLFGSNYNPELIPQIGSYDNATLKSFLTTSPSDPNTRDLNWGQTYPLSRSAPVVVQLRAVAKLQGGSLIYSNWFVYPIEVCTGCLQGACGDLVQTTCPGKCADNSTCTASKCTDGSACTPYSKYVGKFPNFLAGVTGTTVCLPGQAFTAPDCSTNVTCLSTP